MISLMRSQHIQGRLRIILPGVAEKIRNQAADLIKQWKMCNIDDSFKIDAFLVSIMALCLFDVENDDYDQITTVGHMICFSLVFAHLHVYKKYGNVVDIVNS